VALGAQIPDEGFVLLLSDRPAERRALERAIGLVAACRAAESGAGLPPGRPRLAVLDLEAPALAAAEAALDRTVPRLVLARRPDADPGARSTPSASTAQVLPANAPRETVLAGIFALLESATQAERGRARSLLTRGRAATVLVADLFDSAALGARIEPAEIERGTAIVVEAVAEVGIRDWLDTVWRHDAGVYQHTLSVAGFAAAFGTVLGLGAADHSRLARAALLHDIGKSRIPAEILNKPGRLTPEEWRLMQRHPAIGADLLAEQGGTDPAVIAAVRHHHERLDGGGYPDGLVGAAISDLTRLVAICDVYSALTERRAYRASIEPPAALAQMAGDRGHLDPALLAAFRPVALAHAG
jgi:putative nucleotidyltransferase with HDIG domain